ncbi:OmpA family protein [Paraburkholderia phenoliruptrix]|uniref:OmpA family protein n=1 Tax=Paraburkholderia phenoliruptrix TaxID=252970 RepID=UPI001C6F1E90|nr:OmpA family protein [Paraburkholderia phenoliruptrix]MBW9103315.1 OmpA family protein [Paraburkholderia phenoliruptrix]MBW9129484.1 OmpA family protein [Paraburkholderia ginsengiterrae]
MNTTLFRYLRAPLLCAVLTLFAACTTQSGPTYTLRAVSVPNHTAPIYEVSCQGLFESSNSCVRVAEETCHDQPVTWLETLDGVRQSEPVKNPRRMNFMCGKPAVQQPVQEPAQQPASRPPVVPVAPQVHLLLQGNANFATDSATLSAVAKESLDHFMMVNRGVDLHRVTVTGYTDNTGSEVHNLKLSQARAEAVVHYLREGGLKADQLLARGLGSAAPVTSNATAEGRAQNRRVDVRVIAG